MVLLFFLTFIMTSSLHTQSTFDTNNNNIDISFIKQNYQGDESIGIAFSIENRGTEESSFVLSDVLDQSINFELKTSRNEVIAMNHNTDARLTGAFSNPALYRYINLMPGESFSRVFDLRDLYNISTYETFYVKGIFFPDPDNRSVFINSDNTSFSHTPPPLVQQKISEDLIKRTQELDRLATLLPNEIVQSFFEAQFVKDWGKFLLHIDAERLISIFYNYSIQYNNSTDGAFRLELLEKFKRFFTTHWDIPLVSYSINETIIKGQEATVTVDAMESIRFTNRQIRYVFTLYRNSAGKWLISSYTVLSLN